MEIVVVSIDNSRDKGERYSNASNWVVSFYMQRAETILMISHMGCSLQTY